jgi:folate-binding protein YgfZ
LWDGKPSLGKELSLDYNPLEAGLLHSLDMDKGCSIGQEMIKRVYNRKGILKRLWGLTSDKSMKVGDSVLLNDKRIGVVTSASTMGGDGSGGKFVAMGYLKMQINKEVFSAENERVLVAGNEATVRALPYVGYPSFPEEEEEEKEEESEEALEEQRREQKKLEMKARMEEWLKQSKQ